jgi:uncharacterized protein
VSDSSIPPPGGDPVSPAGADPDAVGLPPGDWGAARALAGLAVLLLATLVQVGIVASFDPDIESLGARLALQGLLGATLVAVAVFLLSSGPAPRSEQLGLRRPLVSPWTPAAVAYGVYFACAIALALIFHPEQENVTEELGYGESAAANVAVGFLVIAVAPLTEELFFRGFMFTGLRRQLPFAAAALVPSVVWGLLHYTGPETWGVVAQLAVFGIALSWLYETTGSLWPPIALHVFNNTLAFVILTT